MHRSMVRRSMMCGASETRPMEIGVLQSDPFNCVRPTKTDRRHGYFRQFAAARPYGKVVAIGRCAMKLVVFFVLAGVFSTAVAAEEQVAVAPGVDLIPGAFVPGHQPDGNTLIFRASDGLVVMDTGRHAEHTQRIIDYAHAANLP